MFLIYHGKHKHISVISVFSVVKKILPIIVIIIVVIIYKAAVTDFSIA